MAEDTEADRMPRARGMVGLLYGRDTASGPGGSDTDKKKASETEKDKEAESSRDRKKDTDTGSSRDRRRDDGRSRSRRSDRTNSDNAPRAEDPYMTRMNNLRILFSTRITEVDHTESLDHFMRAWKEIVREPFSSHEEDEIRDMFRSMLEAGINDLWELKKTPPDSIDWDKIPKEQYPYYNEIHGYIREAWDTLVDFERTKQNKIWKTPLGVRGSPRKESLDERAGSATQR